MAIETLYATSHITGNILNPDNALGNTPTTWAGATNTNTSATSRFAMGDPVNPLTSGYTTHTVSAVVRKGTNSGNPSAAINLYENGSLVKGLSGTVTVTSTTGQTISGTFTSAEITNRANIEVELVFTHVGGNSSTRNSSQSSHISLAVDTTAPLAPVSIQGVGTASVTTADTAQLTVTTLPVTITPVGTASVTTADTAQLTVTGGLDPVTITPVGTTSVTVSDTAQLISPGTPNAITDLAISSSDANSVTLTWTEPIGVQ